MYCEDPLIAVVRDAAYEVRRHLGHYFPENVYKHALAYELNLRGHEAVVEAPMTVNYKGTVIASFRADILVDGYLIVELKAVSQVILDHELQLINYLNVTEKDYGILINFGQTPIAFRVKTRYYNRMG